MNRILVRTIAAAVAFSLPACVVPQHPQPKPNSTPLHHCTGKASPDKKLCAHFVEVGKQPAPLNEHRVEILDASGHLLATKNFKSADGDHGRSVAKSAWTANSRFFVFSTQSSGGHSP